MITASSTILADGQGTGARIAPRAVGLWLLGCCAAIFVMVVIGGITRLTESGLSITEWDPVMGALPPMSQAEWQHLFDLYRATPEYLHVNAGMTLAEFRTIFWWEYVHRLWGRAIGLVFLVPLVWFWWRGSIDRPLGLKLLAIFVLGGLQGAIGWWMVKSGLVERTDVSQYRLAVHLGLALLLYGLVLWTALDILDRDRSRGGPPGLGALAWCAIGAVGVTIVAGAFVAGTNAGLIYNSFPWMGEGLLPPDYLFLEPAWLNAFENPSAIQFNHRLVAVAAFGLVVVFWARTLRPDVSPAVRLRAHCLLAAAVAQVAIGIATLLLVVPITLGALHQAGAVAVLTAGLWVAHALADERPSRGAV